MKTRSLILVIILLSLIILVIYRKRESFLGAMAQMNSRGPIDMKLSGGNIPYCSDPLYLIDEPLKKSQNPNFQ